MRLVPHELLVLARVRAPAAHGADVQQEAARTLELTQFHRGHASLLGERADDSLWVQSGRKSSRGHWASGSVPRRGCISKPGVAQRTPGRRLPTHPTPTGMYQSTATGNYIEPFQVS